eukprot:TRINITY_DN5551_c0_g1_i3.p1 TRINITY_DN5551_c0_g1~~TRINITY_DN5551_c0_g1_i3.p1  ORF type:complete len:230 (+),score=44.37 TRINITY_DN5551_c0_g1_i3:404-1093(+)
MMGKTENIPSNHHRRTESLLALLIDSKKKTIFDQSAWIHHHFLIHHVHCLLFQEYLPSSSHHIKVLFLKQRFDDFWNLFPLFFLSFSDILSRYSFLSSMYYRGASVALVLFDITCRDSFDRAKSWVQEVANQIPDPIKTAVVLVGNKVDLESGRQIEQKEGEALAEQYQISYFETSARTGTNIVELFMHTAQEAIDLGCPIAVAKSPSALFISQESIEAKESEQSKCVC